MSNNSSNKPSLKRRASEDEDASNKKKKLKTRAPTDAELDAAVAKYEAARTPILFYSKSADLNARALSNFAPSPFMIGGRWYPTVEHYYQSQKYQVATFPKFAQEFSTKEEGGIPVVGNLGLDAKKAGGKAAMLARTEEQTYQEKLDKKKPVPCPVKILPLGIWERKWQVPVMQAALKAKFQIPKFASLLENTGEHILHHFERTPGFWGTHTKKETGKMIGKNTLGSMLMDLREEKRREAAIAAKEAEKRKLAYEKKKAEKLKLKLAAATSSSDSE